MAFIIDIDIIRPGSTLTTTIQGLMLDINGVETPVPFTEFSRIELDDEDLEEATVMYVTFNSKKYALTLPSKDSPDFDDVREIIIPE